MLLETQNCRFLAPTSDMFSSGPWKVEEMLSNVQQTFNKLLTWYEPHESSGVVHDLGSWNHGLYDHNPLHNIYNSKELSRMSTANTRLAKTLGLFSVCYIMVRKVFNLKLYKVSPPQITRRTIAYTSKHLLRRYDGTPNLHLLRFGFDGVQTPMLTRYDWRMASMSRDKSTYRSSTPDTHS